MNLGAKIKELRLNKELLQRELATILGCSEKAISSYERNYRTPDVNTLNKISAYFNVSVDYLTKDTEENIVKEEQAIYSINNENNLAEVYSLLNKYSNRFTKEQGNDLKDLIEWYIDKNIK
ncbi:helix-turn-helix domain-containing protein [Vallitalea guaymasensis]|uniref:helix-turn-helix domain-containing protein n=1 Tax=Vallitalea guaymasensis TaxID=1185412 RepID=UPI000DE407FB|nr:helix-turn-helix transcriptional regulator [Vallitalea guaymasensis]